MANTCENDLNISGEAEEVKAFMKNVFEVEGGG